MSKRGEAMQADVLAVLRRVGRPASAYDVLDALRPDHPKIAPPTVYRALAALTGDGRAHRIESLNAYVACACAGHRQAAIMAICDDCGGVEENIAPDIVAELSSVAGRSGFAAASHVVEIRGVCASCNPEAARK